MAILMKRFHFLLYLKRPYDFHYPFEWYKDVRLFLCKDLFSHTILAIHDLKLMCSNYILSSIRIWTLKLMMKTPSNIWLSFSYFMIIIFSRLEILVDFIFQKNKIDAEIFTFSAWVSLLWVSIHVWVIAAALELLCKTVF